MMSEKKIAASTLWRRTGCSVISAASSGIRQDSIIPVPRRTSRYSGSERPACRMNHTGRVAGRSPRSARSSGGTGGVTMLIIVSQRPRGVGEVQERVRAGPGEPVADQVGQPGEDGRAVPVEAPLGLGERAAHLGLDPGGKCGERCGQRQIGSVRRRGAQPGQVVAHRQPQGLDDQVAASLGAVRRGPKIGDAGVQGGDVGLGVRFEAGPAGRLGEHVGVEGDLGRPAAVRGGSRHLCVLDGALETHLVQSNVDAALGHARDRGVQDPGRGLGIGEAGSAGGYRSPRRLEAQSWARGGLGGWTRATHAT
jgi:hypothetical protein